MVASAAAALVTAVDITAPRPEVYPEGASDFTGEWVGESAGIFGTLSIQRLASDRYYGRFTSEDGLTRFVINLRQDRATRRSPGAMEPGNLVRFTWQDGRGGRGEGWVLINRENSALSGEIRYGGLGRGTSSAPTRPASWCAGEARLRQGPASAATRSGRRASAATGAFRAALACSPPRWPRCSSVTYCPICALLAPCQPVGSRREDYSKCPGRGTRWERGLADVRRVAWGRGVGSRRREGADG